MKSCEYVSLICIVGKLCEGFVNQIIDGERDEY